MRLGHGLDMVRISMSLVGALVIAACSRESEQKAQLKYTGELWSVHIQTNWTFEETSSNVTFFANRGLGALEFSASRNNDSHAKDDDLHALAKQHLDAGAPVLDIACGAFSGFYLHYSVGDTYRRKWWLRRDDVILLATYTSDLSKKGNEDFVIDSILTTLKRP
jgi:hypothetical protein